MLPVPPTLSRARTFVRRGGRKGGKVPNRYLAVLLLGPVGAAVTQAQDAEPGYLTHAQLSAKTQQLAADHDEACTTESIGDSREGRDIVSLRLAMPGEVEPDRRPALLLAANIDGDHLVGRFIVSGSGSVSLEYKSDKGGTIRKDVRLRRKN